MIVAGAGPAGAVAARTLAAAGFDTLLVDRATFPRNKPCGGGISVRALTRFPWLAGAIDEIDVHRIAKLHLEGPGGITLDLDSGDPAVLLIRRVEFDHALVRAAEKAGAQTLSGFEITQADADERGVTLQSRDGRTLTARTVVAADGVHSVIAKRLGVNPRWPRTSIAIDMMEETPNATLRAVRPDVLWVAYACNGLDGYSYIFPKTDHVNVGIGCLLSHFDDEVGEAPYALQEKFVAALVASGDLEGRSDRTHFTPYLIPVGGPLPKAWHGRVLFAGDAGGFVNAITAEGIYYAMVSGELAARAIVSTPSAADAAVAGKSYEKLWRDEIGAELADSVLMQRFLFSSHDRVARAIRGATTVPGLTDAILDYVRGSLSYSGLRRRMLLKFPMALMHMARERVRRVHAVKR